MISVLQRDVNELQSLLTTEPISPDDTSGGDGRNNRPTKKRRRRGAHQDDTAKDSLDSSSDESEVYNKGVDENEEDEEEISVASKFSCVSDKSNKQLSDASSDKERSNKHTKKKIRSNEDDVIDLAGSSSSSDSSSDDDDESEDDDDESEDDDDSVARYHISKIKHSKLTMATQGFRCQATMSNENGSTDNDMTDDDAAGSDKSNRNHSLEDHAPFDPSSIEYEKKTFHINHCYILKEGGAIVGIKHFISKDTAHCVLIVRFEDTLLGTEDQGLAYEADYMLGSYVQVYKYNENICLSKLGDESQDVETIPRLIYQPQTHGEWYTFGYFYDQNELMQRRIKLRLGSIRSLECFVGAGGSLQGYKNMGFETVCAIDNDHDAIATLKQNHPELNTYDGDIKDFKDHVGVLGSVEHIHWSSPCQDFSQANRSLNGSNQVSGKRDRADLSLLLVDYVQLKRPLTAVFENVCGIYQRKNVHYLKNITKRLMQLGYQVRCTVLKACDYGDPQKRPRFFMFISRRHIPMPSIPAPTHGDAPHLWSYVTVKEALGRVNDTLPNMQGRTSSLLPQHGVIRLKPHECAPTIRAGSVTPFHYSKDRCINVREAATLQSFPLDYKFCGSLSSQYKQVGNAVPIELASAVAQAIKQVLMYEYKEEEEEEDDDDIYKY